MSGSSETQTSRSVELIEASFLVKTKNGVADIGSSAYQGYISNSSRLSSWRENICSVTGCARSNAIVEGNVEIDP